MMPSVIAAAAFLLLSAPTAVQGYANSMACTGSASWEPDADFGAMGIPAFSPSTTACTISVSPDVLEYTVGQEYTATITSSTTSLGMKAVLVGGSTIDTVGSGGAKASQSTCVNYNARASQRTFVFKATSQQVTIRALCGGNRAAVYVAPELVLTAAAVEEEEPTDSPTETTPTLPGDTAAPTTTTTARPTPFPTSFEDDDSTGGNNGEDDDDYAESISIEMNPMLVAHIVLMITGMALFLPWAVTIALFNNNNNNNNTGEDGGGARRRRLVCGLGYNSWLTLHLSFAVIGFVLGLAGFATGIVSVRGEDSEGPPVEHFVTAHTRLGLVVIILCALQILAGLTRKLWKAVFPQVHFTLGFALVILALAACLCGVDELARVNSGLPYNLNGMVGDVGFSGPMGIAVAVICAVQLLVLAVGLAMRLGEKNKLCCCCCASGRGSSDGDRLDDGSAPMLAKSAANNNNNNNHELKPILMSHVNASKHLFVFNTAASAAPQTTSNNNKNSLVVVDVERFAAQHPGGAKVFATHKGKDITQSFQRVGHSSRARQTLNSLVIGRVVAGGAGAGAGAGSGPASAASSSQDLHAARELAFSDGRVDNDDDDDEFFGGKQAVVFLQGAAARKQVTIVQKTALSHNMFEFKLEFRPATTLGLPVGKHVCVFGQDSVGGGEIQRKYTPTAQGLGWFKLVIKINKERGKMGALLDKTRVGHTLVVSGPVGLEEYLGHGQFRQHAPHLRFTDLLCVAGGSGITPFLQLANAILSPTTSTTANKDPTRIHLLACHSTIWDVVLQRELEDMQRKHPGQFHVWFTVSQPPASAAAAWPYSVGRVSADLVLRRYGSKLPRATTLAIACGPPGFLSSATAALAGAQFDHIAEY